MKYKSHVNISIDTLVSLTTSLVANVTREALLYGISTNSKWLNYNCDQFICIMHCIKYRDVI